MIALIQRHTQASVVVEDKIIGKIKNGFNFVFLGISRSH
jgi:D-Tyr-tRNAtyr deacylase